MKMSSGELAQMEQAGKNAERCVCCGAIIPEGRQVCPICEKGGKNMPRYIDAEVVLERLKIFDRVHADLKHGNEHFIYGIETAVEVIEDTPTADVVEVVRCKDCKWCEDCGKGNYLCHNQMVGINPEFYCAGAERRKDNG